MKKYRGKVVAKKYTWFFSRYLAPLQRWAMLSLTAAFLSGCIITSVTDGLEVTDRRAAIALEGYVHQPQQITVKVYAWNFISQKYDLITSSAREGTIAQTPSRSFGGHDLYRWNLPAQVLPDAYWQLQDRQTEQVYFARLKAMAVYTNKAGRQIVDTLLIGRHDLNECVEESLTARDINPLDYFVTVCTAEHDYATVYTAPLGATVEQTTRRQGDNREGSRVFYAAVHQTPGKFESAPYRQSHGLLTRAVWPGAFSTMEYRRPYGIQNEFLPGAKKHFWPEGRLHNVRHGPNHGELTRDLTCIPAEAAEEERQQIGGRYVLNVMPECAQRLVWEAISRVITQDFIEDHHLIFHSRAGHFFDRHRGYLERLQNRLTTMLPRSDRWVLANNGWLPGGRFPLWRPIAGQPVPEVFRYALESPDPRNCASTARNCNGWIDSPPATRAGMPVGTYSRFIRTEPQRPTRRANRRDVCQYLTIEALHTAMNPWHGRIHAAVNGDGRNNSEGPRDGFFHHDAPAFPLFFAWHAYVDYLYAEWQRCPSR